MSKFRVTLGPQSEPIFIRDDSYPQVERGPQGEIIIPHGAHPAPDVDHTKPLSNTVAKENQE